MLNNIRKASIKPDGVFLMQDIKAHGATCTATWTNPLGPFIYTVSCMHCMSVSLANNGPGLGGGVGPGDGCA